MTKTKLRKEMLMLYAKDFSKNIHKEKTVSRTCYDVLSKSTEEEIINFISWRGLNKIRMVGSSGAFGNYLIKESMIKEYSKGKADEEVETYIKIIFCHDICSFFQSNKKFFDQYFEHSCNYIKYRVLQNFGNYSFIKKYLKKRKVICLLDNNPPSYLKALLYNHLSDFQIAKYLNKMSDKFESVEESKKTSVEYKLESRYYEDIHLLVDKGILSNRFVEKKLDHVSLYAITPTVSERFEMRFKTELRDLHKANKHNAFSVISKYISNYKDERIYLNKAFLIKFIESFLPYMSLLKRKDVPYFINLSQEIRDFAREKGVETGGLFGRSICFTHLDDIIELKLKDTKNLI
jgi:hypothetical protein